MVPSHVANEMQLQRLYSNLLIVKNTVCAISRLRESVIEIGLFLQMNSHIDTELKNALSKRQAATG